MTKNAYLKYLGFCSLEALRSAGDEAGKWDQEIAESKLMIEAIDINLEREKLKEA